MTATFGSLPGFNYSIGATEGTACIFCGRTDAPVMRAQSRFGVCEPCSRLADYAWRESKGGFVPGHALPKTSSVSLVVIVRDRPSPENLVVPFDILMVGRKDDSGFFGLPGGKAERNETPEETAVRELREETSIETWPSALEILYVGYTPRCRLATVYLCRGYHGEAAAMEDVPVEWKPTPIPNFTGHLHGFHIGIQEALNARVRAQKKAASTTPFSVEFSSIASQYVEISLKHARTGAKEMKPNDAKLLVGYGYMLTGDEKDIITLITGTETQNRDARALALMPRLQAPPPVAPGDSTPEPVGEQDEGRSADDDAAEADEEAEEELSTKDRDKGFVR